MGIVSLTEVFNSFALRTPWRLENIFLTGVTMMMRMKMTMLK